jgi:hypothetical protein
MSVSRGHRSADGTVFFDTARCRARIAGMPDEELDDYIRRVKTRLVHSHEDSYFLEESLLIQLGEACEERKRRQSRLKIGLNPLHSGRRNMQPRREMQEAAGATD